MKINDIVYGEVEYKDPVILELLNSKALNRLKGVSQYGVPDKYWFKDNYDRYEHSVGVMNLLNKLGASTEEQIAGLLHDVSQFSFSHISDWVFGEGHKGDESYHDTQHNSFVLTTEIPEILKQHNYSISRILDDNNFPLLENDIPDICADRIDYCFRELVHDGDKKIIYDCLNHLSNINNKIVFSNEKSASIFSNAFLDLQLNYWASEEGVKRYWLFSSVFKIAVSKNLVQHDDFWNKSEKDLMEVIINSGDPKILEILGRLEKGDIEEKIGLKVQKKLRYVDPLVVVGSKLERLSDIDIKFKERIVKEREKNSLGFIV